MGPVPVAQFPDPGVRLPPPLPDGVRGDAGGRPAVVVHTAVLGRGGEEQQGFTEAVELELPVDVIADPVVATG